MRTPKPLYVDQRIIYHPELSTCRSCDGPVVGCNDLKWDKVIQTLDEVLSIASRPGHCPDPECPGHACRLLSAQGQSLAPANSTYGYDVIARIGWLRQHYFATHDQIHADLSQRVAISASLCALFINAVICPFWRVMSAASAGDWTRSQASKAA